MSERRGQWSPDGAWWWNGQQWLPAAQAPPEAGKPPGAPEPPPPPPGPQRPSAGRQKSPRPRWLIPAIAIISVLSMGICIAAVASPNNQALKTTSTPTPIAPAAGTLTPKPATPAAAANQAGTCTPQPCANDNFGWIVNASNLRYDLGSGNDFEKPEAGDVFVAVDVTFTNKLKTEQHANPTEFVLQDGAGIKHQITFMTNACPTWQAVNVTSGATFGPKCLAFEASAGKPNGLVLVWTPSFAGGNYNMKLS